MMSAASGASDQGVKGVYEHVFHGDSNGTIGGHVRLLGAEILLV
jgi:hypothetical protein